MVPPQEDHVIGVLDFEGDEQAKHLDTVPTSVNVVP